MPPSLWQVALMRFTGPFSTFPEAKVRVSHDVEPLLTSQVSYSIRELRSSYVSSTTRIQQAISTDNVRRLNARHHIRGATGNYNPSTTISANATMGRNIPSRSVDEEVASISDR